VLEEPGFRANAERLAAAIASDTAEDQAVQELERLADQSRTGGSSAVPSAA
jgi:hypothetical protein